LSALVSPAGDEPFRAMSLCNLMNILERWTAEETVGGLLFGSGQPAATTKTDDRLPVFVRVCHRRRRLVRWSRGPHPGHFQRRMVRDGPVGGRRCSCSPFGPESLGGIQRGGLRRRLVRVR
jgi:hypothetical protein